MQKAKTSRVEPRIEEYRIEMIRPCIKKLVHGFFCYIGTFAI